VDCSVPGSVSQLMVPVAVSCKHDRESWNKMREIYCLRWFLRWKFIAALGEYQHRCPDRRQPYRRVLERVRCSLKETGILVTLAFAGRGRLYVRNEEEVLDTVQDNPSPSTRNISSVTGRLYQRAAWSTVRGIKLYPFHVQPVQARVSAGNKHLRV
jgi:hypothetical protein